MVHLRDHAMKASPTNKLLHRLMHHEVGISIYNCCYLWLICQGFVNNKHEVCFLMYFEFNGSYFYEFDILRRLYELVAKRYTTRKLINTNGNIEGIFSSVNFRGLYRQNYREKKI
jgi:hypothetical protein